MVFAIPISAWRNIFFRWRIVKEKEKILWQKLSSASPKKCGKLIDKMLKIKLK